MIAHAPPKASRPGKMNLRKSAQRQGL